MSRLFGRFDVPDKTDRPPNVAVPARDLALDQEIVMFRWQPDASEIESGEDRVREIANQFKLEAFCDGTRIYLTAPDAEAASPAIQHLTSLGLFATPAHDGTAGSTTQPTNSICELCGKPALPGSGLCPTCESKVVPSPVKRKRSGWKVFFALMLIACILVIGGIAASFYVFTPLPAITTAAATPDKIDKGTQFRLSWNASDADSVSISTGFITLFQDQPAGGYVDLTASADTTYTIIAHNHRGESAPSRVEVRVDPPISIRFSFEGVNTLRWRVVGAQSLEIAPDLGKVSRSGSAVVSGGSYSLIAIRPSGRTVVKVAKFNRLAQPPQPEGITLPVKPPSPLPQTEQPLPTINYFYAEPQTINRCESTILKWSVERSMGMVFIRSIDLPLLPTSSLSLSPLTTTDYSLSASRSLGSAVTKSTIVYVNPPIPGRPLECDEIQWVGVVPSDGRIIIEWPMRGSAQSDPPATKITGHALPYAGVRITPQDSFLQVVSQPHELGVPKVILHSARTGSQTLHFRWDKYR